MYYTDNDFRLYHHGVKGQRWGVRRYQNADGSLTAAGRKHVHATQEKIESLNSRLKRSMKGEKLSRKIDKLEAKTPTDKRLEKIDKLKSLRDQKLSDLTENEIKYGRMYIEEQSRITPVVAAGYVVGGLPGGLLAAAGYSTVRRFTKEGKEFNDEFNATAKAVREENKNRIQNEKDKAAGIVRNPGPKMSREDFFDYGDYDDDNDPDGKRLERDYAEYSKSYDRDLEEYERSRR